MNVRIKGKPVEPANSNSKSNSNSTIKGVNITITPNQSTRDIVDTCVAGVVFYYNATKKSKVKMSKLECLLNLLIPNNPYIDTLTDKIHNEIGMMKISKEEIVKCVKDLVYRDINFELNKESKEIKKANSKFSNYDILCKMQQMNKEDKIVDKILNNKNINIDRDVKYEKTLKKELRKIIKAVIENEKERDFEEEVKRYTNNYENFLNKHYMDTANKGYFCYIKFSNVEYSMKFKRLLDELNKFGHFSERERINKLLADETLTVSERNILKGRAAVLPESQTETETEKTEKTETEKTEIER